MFHLAGLLATLLLGPHFATPLKMWTPSASLDDPSNWASDSQPSLCDRLLMNSAQDVTIQMPTTEKFKMKSIVFPRQGVLTFPKKSSLTLSGINECTSKVGKDVRFVPPMVGGWLDPRNWNSTSQDGWVPHNARVPCAGEIVVFPSDKSMSVMLPSVLVPSGPISFKGKVMDSDQWSKFLQSEEGYESFKGSQDIRGMDWQTDSGCLNEKTCFCTRHAYAIKDWSFVSVASEVYNEAVCMYARPRCDRLEVAQCYSPVYPEGHCCGVCGAILNLRDETENGIRLASVRAIAASVIKEYGSNVQFYVGRRTNGGIQIVLLASDGDPFESLTIVHTINQQLQNENIGSVEALLYSGFSKNTNRKSAVFTLIFGTLTAMLAFFASVYYVFMVLPKNKWNPFTKRDPFTFARFRNTLPEAVSTETLVLETDRPTTDSFANPLYNPDGAVAMSTISPNSASSKVNELPSKATEKSKKDELVDLDDPIEIPLPQEDVTPLKETSESESDDEASVGSFSKIRDEEGDLTAFLEDHKSI